MVGINIFFQAITKIDKVRYLLDHVVNIHFTFVYAYT